MAKETTTKKTTTKKSTTAKEVATPDVATTVAGTEANVSSADRTVADKLIALSRLQETFTKIDHIKTLRGELPLEVQGSAIVSLRGQQASSTGCSHGENQNPEG